MASRSTRRIISVMVIGLLFVAIVVVCYTFFSSKRKVHDTSTEFEITKLGSFLKFSEDKTLRSNLDKLKGELVDQSYEISSDPHISPPSRRITAKLLFINKLFVMWSKDWRTARLDSLAVFLKSFGVSLQTVVDPQDCLRMDCEMNDRLKTSMDMGSIDLILCGQPTNACDYFLKSNKNTLVLPSLSYYAKGYTMDQLIKMNEEFAKLSTKRGNVFASSNLYDACLFQYYTGINVELLPTIHDEVRMEYSKEIDEILILDVNKSDYFSDYIYEELISECQKVQCSIKVRRVEAKNDLNKYRSIIVIPREVSMTSIMEAYRMNIPMVMPSPELLATWQMKYYIIPKRISIKSNNSLESSSTLPPHPSQTKIPDPTIKDYKNVLYWMKLSDYYQSMPHIVLYDNISDLVSTLVRMNDDYLMEISKKMKEYNLKFKKELIKKWRDVLLYFSKESNIHHL